MYFILIKPVSSEHLSYVTLFWMFSLNVTQTPVLCDLILNVLFECHTNTCLMWPYFECSLWMSHKHLSYVTLFWMFSLNVTQTPVLCDLILNVLFECHTNTCLMWPYFECSLWMSHEHLSYVTLFWMFSLNVTQDRLDCHLVNFFLHLKNLALKDLI